MDEKLKAAYDALEAADKAGNVEDARQLADYIETLKAQQTPAAQPEQVIERESPEIMGGIGGTAGAVGAVGDIIYSKGRPLIRMAEKAMNREPSTPVAKARTFLDPSAVAQQAIERRTVPEVPEGSTTTVRNWTVGKPGEGTGQHAGEFLGGANYKEANKIAEEALATERQFPGRKVLPGSLIAVPEHEANRIAKERAALALQEDAAKQAEVQAVAQRRAERLGERAALSGKQTKFDIAKGTGSILGKAIMPIAGGYEAGSQGAQAYNRLTRPNLTAGDIASGAANVIGSAAGATSALPIPPKYRVPAAILAQGAGAVANWLDKRNPRNEPLEPVEQKAVGGLAGYAGGKKVIAEKVAKKGAELVKGYLHNTAINPNELVGTRFKTTDLGGLLPQHDFDPSRYMGAKILHRPYDLSSRNQLVEEVSGHKIINPVRTEGGQAFGRDIENQAIGLGGASNKDINDRILKRVEAAAREGNGQVLNNPSSMSFGSEAFSPMPISLQLDILRQREFSPEIIKQLNEQVRGFDKKNPERLKNFLGFEHPEVEKQLLEGGYGLNTSPGQLRIAASDRLGLKQNQKLLDYNIEDLYHALRDPDLRNTPPGYMGLTMMEAKPSAQGFDFGRHSAYDSGDASTYVGKGVNAPISVWMPDTYKEALARLKAEQPGANLTNLRSQARNILGTSESGVAQTMNQQVVDNLGRYKEAVESGNLDPNDLDAIHKYIYGNKAGEYAAGGDVQGYSDGKSVLPDVSLDTRSIPSISGMPGVGYMQTPQGAMARLQMQKELEDARIRAGISGMAMALPGQQGIRTMPGQMDIGANVPVGPGNLDISANRSINPIPGRGHMQGVNARYTIPFADGGEVEHFETGGTALAKAALKMVKPAVNRLEMNYKDVTKRIPQLQEAAKKLQNGELTREEYEHLVNTHKPVTPYSFIPSPAGENEARDAVGKKITKGGLDLWQHPIPEGHQVGLRLDIPAYTNKGVWVNSIHNEGEKGVIPNTSYSNVSAVKNAVFGMPQDEMLGIAAGASKSPKAKITGNWHPVDEQSAVANAQEYLAHPDWRQVGMDPERHGYFYDRETMEPITHAEEALQIGPLVLAKKPTYASKEEFKYAKGGKTKKKK